MTDFIQTVLSPLVGDAVQPLHTSNYFLIRKLFRACNSCAVSCQAPGVKSSKIDIKIYSSNFFKCSHTRLTCWGHIRSNNNPSAPESGLICFFALELINLKNIGQCVTFNYYILKEHHLTCRKTVEYRLIFRPVVELCS